MKLSELRSERMLLLKEGHCFRDDALRICSRGRIPFHPMFETDQFSSIFPMVAAGVGITLPPAMAAGVAGGCRFLSLKLETFRGVSSGRRKTKDREVRRLNASPKVSVFFCVQQKVSFPE